MNLWVKKVNRLKRKAERSEFDPEFFNRDPDRIPDKVREEKTWQGRVQAFGWSVHAGVSTSAASRDRRS